MATHRICGVEECGKQHLARGYCNTHYLRSKKYGDPLAGPTFMGAAVQYYEKVVRTHCSEECLIWPYSKGSDGYARIKPVRGQTLVQRLICFDLYGPPPDPIYEAAHTCGRGMQGCVNPRHVRWASREENAADRVDHGTAPRGVNCGRAKLCEDDVRTIRKMKASNATNREVAGHFDISKTAVSNINTGITWWWLD